MLPVLRVIPVGGVTLAILILILALNPPGESRPPLPRGMMPARGALIARADHPEWRQLLVNAALQRAEALSELRQLPETFIKNDDKAMKAETPKKADEVAGVPASQSEAQSEDVTGTVAQSPKATIPIDIGEASSTELPVAPHEERPPVILTPERSKPPHESLNVAPAPTKPAQVKPKVTAEPAKPPAESRRRSANYSHRARVMAETGAPVQFNFLQAFFASFAVNQQTAKPRR
jgi:hypothetical protein